MKTYVQNDRIVKVEMPVDDKKVKTESKEEVTTAVKEVHLLQE